MEHARYMVRAVAEREQHHLEAHFSIAT